MIISSKLKYLFVGITILVNLSYLYGQDDSLLCDSLYKDGLKLFQKGELDSAEFKSESILEVNDKFAEAYYLLGCIYNKRDPESYKVQEYLKTALEINPKFLPAYIQLGYTLLESFDYSNQYEAPDYFEMAIKIDSTYLPAWIALLDYYNRENDTEESIMTLRKAIEFFPGNISLLSQLEEIIFWNSELELGKTIFLDLVTRNPNSIPFNIALARINYQQQNYNEALSILNKVEKIPGIPAVRGVEVAKMRSYFSESASIVLFEAYLRNLNVLLNKLS